MKTAVRRLVQLSFLAGLTFLFIRQDYTQVRQPVFMWLGWLDPLTGLSGFIQRQWPWLISVSLAVLGLTVWRKRFFCGWLCPVGTVLDLLGLIKRLLWKDLKPGPKTRHWLNRLRWMLLGGVIAFVLLGYPVVLAFDPLVLWPREVHRAASWIIPWSLAGVILLGFATFPRFWCRFLCPAGSVFNLAGRLSGRPFLVGETCRECGLCRKHCPNLNITENLHFGSDCLDCGLCRKICSKKSVMKPKKREPVVNESRRDLLLASSIGLGLIAAGAAAKSLPIAWVAAPRKWSRLLRPPGALREEAFVLTCNRCGQCLSVCPTKALAPAGLEAGLSGVATPRFVPRRGRCMLGSCLACARVCPTKALAPVPMEEIRLGTANINRQTCVAWARGTRCLLCVEVCPTFAITIDPKGRPLLDGKKCVGCGACEANCPVEGAAVRVRNDGEKRR